jgi:hypothetical protein
VARSRVRHRVGAVALIAIALGASGPAARATVTIGQIGPPSGTICEGDDLVQPTVTSGNSYVVPGTGTITTWTTYGGPTGGVSETMKILRLTAAPATYQVVGHSGPQPVSANGTAGNTFTAKIPVKPGDVLGANAASYCVLDVPGEQYGYHVGGLADGQQAPFGLGNNFRLNIQATFVPENGFQVRSVRRNRNKGTATLAFDLSNPGVLTATGRGATARSIGAHTSKTVGAGVARLVIKAKGKKRRKLNQDGTVKVPVSITYTPTGGDPNTQGFPLVLKKNV